MLDSKFFELAYPKLDNVISLYQEDSMFWLSGITFREFMLGDERPTRLLLLKHECRFADSDDYYTRLDFVDEDLNALIAADVIGYGDFWWVDCESRECLGELPEAEFLRLLHLKQLGRPQSPPHFPTLQNHFAYLGHDDGWALHLWVDSPKLLGRILANALTLKYVTFSGRRSFPKPNEAIANELVHRAVDGIVIDFRHVDAHATSVPVYCIGAVKNSDCARRLSDEYVKCNSINEWLVVEGDRWRHERFKKQC